MKEKLSAAANRRSRLLVEIALVVAVKLFAVFCLWYGFFSPDHRTAVTPESMGEQLLGPQPRSGGS